MGHPRHSHTVGGYSARYQYSDPVIWMTLTLSCELHAELRHFTDFSPDSVTSAQKSLKVQWSQTLHEPAPAEGFFLLKGRLCCHWGLLGVRPMDSVKRLETILMVTDAM